ncbi:hypothetical protein AGMMS49936_08380 [Endomicrobiia bacterium]|nr:hypothetical protein AGMMS49936_08380 [Endomicrobiia bacterium]
MIKFKAVAFGLFVLISSICSSTEARAEGIVEDLTEEKVVLTKIFGELKNKIVSDLGKEGGDVIVRPGMKHPVAETIKQCNIIEKKTHED